jgi:prevent-host-death family protein
MYMAGHSITVADLRRELSRVLRLVENGQEVVVTRHGQGVARLAPVQDVSQRLEAAGVRPAERQGALPRIRPSNRRTSRSLTRAVLEDRA